VATGHAPASDLCLEAEGTEGAGGVAGPVDVAACMAPSLFALDHATATPIRASIGQRLPGVTAPTISTRRRLDLAAPAQSAAAQSATPGIS
jgi:hypothetical protein